NRPFDLKKLKAASLPPVFAADAAVTAKETGWGEIGVAAPAAASADGQPVVLYRVIVKNKLGLTVEKQWYLPHYYVADHREETIPFTVTGLARGSYTVRVVAETAYGVQSAPLETELRVENGVGAVGAFFRLLARPFKLLIAAIKHVF
ncbi:MAG: hypothetical protein II621_02005, partial [Clostridia bacterium]|nr:hypothetical protein [Clostridia bacterium]